MRKLFVMLFSSILVLSIIFANGSVEAKDTTPPKTLTVNKITTKTTSVTGKTEGKAKVEIKLGKISLGKATAINNGKFNVKIKAQKKGTKLTVIAKDKAGNAKKTTVTVYQAPIPFKSKETIEKDGVKFDVTLISSDLQPNKKLNVKVKATNVSEEAISYIGYDACDHGLHAAVYTEDKLGEVFEGGKSGSHILSCAQVIKNYSLDPGETIEVSETFIIPTKGFNNHFYVIVTFQKGLTADYPLEPIEVRIDIK